MRIECSVYQEKLIARGGTPVAEYPDGSVAIVDNSFGKGKTRLVGTFPGATYLRTLDHEPELLIRDALRYAGVRPKVQPLDGFVKARLHKGSGGIFLWALNTSYDGISSEITLLATVGSFSKAKDLVTGRTRAVRQGVIRVSLEPLKGTVLRLT